MAAQGTRGSSTKKKNTSAGRANTAGSRAKNRSARQDAPMDPAVRNEILLIVLAALALILFLCNFGLVGKFGSAVSSVMFGIFGLLAYVAPVIIFLMVAFGMLNAGNHIATRKLAAGILFFILLGMSFEFFSANPAGAESYQIAEIYARCSEGHTGGGIIAGSFTYLSCKFLGTVGTVLLILVLGIICLVIVTEKSFIGGVAAGGRKVYERSLEDAAYRRERAARRREEQSERREREARERRQREEELENEKLLRMDKKVSGVMLDTALGREPERAAAEKVRDDIHEITLNYDEEDTEELPPVREREQHSYHYIEQESDALSEIYMEEEEPVQEPEPVSISSQAKKPMDSYQPMTGNQMAQTPGRERVSAVSSPAQQEERAAASAGKGGRDRYRFPTPDLLAPQKKKKGADSDRELKETAQRLEQILGNFGVKVSVTQYSRGPSVTRYELQPEQGVKVSKIVGLADDIKLNLAATDIRIEAPIPGKAAVGIEVPNKENTAVPFRDLVESPEFDKFQANLIFAVGKDIGGKTVLADIAKMPHLLIAGATGSGKSVCINTIIMGILFKAHPNDVKMIMIDPKVVELSVYNGIPHLLIPVVTDPKKAAAALHWGVAEMTERYKKFADFNVRDLKGYNKKVESMQTSGDPNAPEKMPQILIIVDELADLMMVSPGEVEESICRLAQLARACGIHLIIATQRPSVDVITGLIKANMPSRVAFAVSSGVDSRTILDMVGAEKLLGKGDMLFYPQGYPKPARIQGPFVSDDEVSNVVEFLKDYAPEVTADEAVEEQINSIAVESGTPGTSGGAGDAESAYDEYFAEAGRFIIEKDKASIGMLQRMFKIGFNRAARIMDQLCEAGVVGEEEGTKPRKILMSAEEFEQILK
ncbi:MAG: DNA translocase FtsK [Lachnospiraceae bacterium]|nr:DNA translocase FtsK [Lachnospiraceae bacterium]